MSDEIIPSLYPWHKVLWDHLYARLQDNKLPHALLITAEPGFAQNVFADNWSAKVLCTGDMNLACRHCRSCQLFQSASHPDLYVLDLEEGAKFIKIDQVRRIIERLCQKPQMSDKRVVLIRNSDKMTTASANSLLKTLEEPITDTYFILLSRHARKLLPTISSRCQQLRLQVSTDVALEWLESKQISKQRAQQLLKAAGGAPLQALDMLGSDFLNIRQDVLDDLILLCQGKLSVIHISEKWLALEHGNLVNILYNILNDLLKLSWQLPDNNLNYSDLSVKLQTLLNLLRVVDLLEMTESLRRLSRESNANRQLLLENLLICWSGLRK